MPLIGRIAGWIGLSAFTYLVGNAIDKSKAVVEVSAKPAESLKTAVVAASIAAAAIAVVYYGAPIFKK